MTNVVSPTNKSTIRLSHCAAGKNIDASNQNESSNESSIDAGDQEGVTSVARWSKRWSKNIAKVNKTLGSKRTKKHSCAFSSSFCFFRFVYYASYCLLCDVIFKPPFYLPYGPFLKRKSDQNKNPADPPLTATSISPLLSFKNWVRYFGKFVGVIKVSNWTTIFCQWEGV